MDIVAERCLKNTVFLKLGILLLSIKLTFCSGIKEIMDLWQAACSLYQDKDAKILLSDRIEGPPQMDCVEYSKE